MARFLSSVASMPEVRTDKVQAVKDALADGRYDIDGKLPEALNAFLDENL